jgi:hypothetical protein
MGYWLLLPRHSKTDDEGGEVLKSCGMFHELHSFLQSVTPRATCRIRKAEWPLFFSQKTVCQNKSNFRAYDIAIAPAAAQKTTARNCRA